MSRQVEVHMTRTTAAPSIRLAILLAATTACSDMSGPGKTLGRVPGVIVSEPVGTPGAASTGVAMHAAASPTGTSVVYVSLVPGSVPTGVQATIRDPARGQWVTTFVVDGGFDPVALGASVGDTLVVEITRSGSVGPLRGVEAVPALRPIAVVRTSPPSGGRDVPLNSIMIIVFSEPIDTATLTTATVQLWRATTQVPGSVRFSDSTDIRAEFHPDSLLASTTEYQLIVTQGIRGVNSLSLPSPLDVPFTTGTTEPATDLVFASVSAGSYYTCGLTTGGAAYCWGNNSVGQLGNGTTATSATPIRVAGGLTFSSVSTNDWYTCGVTIAGAAYCWGRSDLLGVGRDSATLSACTPTAYQYVYICSTPVPVAGGLTFASVSTGYGHACGVTTGGAAYCWGGDWDMGELGATWPLDPSTPVAVSGGLSFATVSAGGYQSCGVTTTGAAYCWGANFSGDLGIGTTTGPEQCATTDQGGQPITVNCSRIPVAVSGGLTFVTLSTGGAYACGVTPASAVYCWGGNPAGELGNGTTVSSATPVPVAGGLTVASVSTSTANHTCGVTPTHSAYCWGRNDTGQLGDGSAPVSHATPAAVVGGLSFSAVSAGEFHTCGVTMSGTLYCWGENYYGELGTGTTTSSNVPVKVAGQR
jgi:alpha-tubulin suppressor-like RCC1 family protein